MPNNMRAPTFWTILFCFLAARRHNERAFCRNSDQFLDECALAAGQAQMLDLASVHELQPNIHERFTLDFVRVRQPKGGSLMV